MYRSLRSTIFTLALVLTAVAVGAQQVSFNLVRPQNVVEGRRFHITFRLTNGDANPPKAPQLEGCRAMLNEAQISTMESTEIINGRMNSTFTKDFTYIYLAEKAGQVNIPALTVNVNGKQYSSKPASFNILPADNAQQQGSQGYPSAPVQADDPRTQTPGNVSANDLFVRVSFSKAKAYEQEAVIATIKVYTKYDISSFLVTTQPVFEGFLSEELPVKLETQLENYNNQNYHTAVLKRLLLFPQKSGTLTVNSGKYDVTVVQYETVNMGFFRTRRPIERAVTTSSNAATIQILPLPQPQPADFSGAVGSFTVSTELHPELLKTNEAATYTYTVKGTGNIKHLTEPKIDFPAGIDSYTPKTDVNASFTGTTDRGTFSVEYTIVPQEVGKSEIVSPPFTYFDLDKKEYITLQPQSFEINVARGASTSAVVEQRSIDKTISDIRYIRPVTSQSKQQSYTFNSVGYWLAWIAAVGALLAVILVYRRQLKLRADVKGRKLARAGRVAAKRLRQARSLMNTDKSDQFYAELNRALWGYVSDKLGIAPSQLTRDNISAKLTEIGTPESTIADVITVLDECEMARFTPQHSSEEMRSLFDKASQAIDSLETATKR